MNAQTYISHRMFVAALTEARHGAAALNRRTGNAVKQPVPNRPSLSHECNPASEVRPTFLPAESLLDRAAAC